MVRAFAPLLGHPKNAAQFGIAVASRTSHHGDMKAISSLVLVACGLAALAPLLAAAEAPILPALKDELVVADGKKLKKFDDSALAQTKYYGIYYSAAWCGPCRAFTPDLVKWYKRNKNENPHFELIFVSSDRSEEDMAAYMKEDDMTWPALDFNKKKSNRTLTQYAGNGIPCLVFVDAEGKVLSHSYEGKTYVGPRKVLVDMEKTLKGDPASAEAKAAVAGAAKKTGNSSFDDFFKKKPAGQ
jgi:nucleoredoxin